MSKQVHRVSIGNKYFKVPDWANWIAQNEDGSWYGFKHKPLIKKWAKDGWSPRDVSDGFYFHYITTTQRRKPFKEQLFKLEAPFIDYRMVRQ